MKMSTEDELDAVKQIYHVASEKFDDWLMTAISVGDHSHARSIRNPVWKAAFFDKKKEMNIKS